MLFDAHAATLSPNEQFVLDLAIVTVAMASLVFTDSKFKSKNPGLIFTILVVLAISGRLLLNPIPNVQPVTFLVIMVGILIRDICTENGNVATISAIYNRALAKKIDESTVIGQ